MCRARLREERRAGLAALLDAAQRRQPSVCRAAQPVRYLVLSMAVATLTATLAVSTAAITIYGALYPGPPGSVNWIQMWMVSGVYCLTVVGAIVRVACRENLHSIAVCVRPTDASAAATTDAGANA